MPGRPHVRELPQTVDDVDWSEAACNDGFASLTPVFFSDNSNDVQLAKAVCSTCALARPCLEGALARREPAGVWGGQLFVNGRVERASARSLPARAASGGTQEDKAVA